MLPDVLWVKVDQPHEVPGTTSSIEGSQSGVAIDEYRIAQMSRDATLKVTYSRSEDAEGLP